MRLGSFVLARNRLANLATLYSVIDTIGVSETVGTSDPISPLERRSTARLSYMELGVDRLATDERKFVRVDESLVLTEIADNGLIGVVDTLTLTEDLVALAFSGTMDIITLTETIDVAVKVDVSDTLTLTEEAFAPEFDTVKLTEDLAAIHIARADVFDNLVEEEEIFNPDTFQFETIQTGLTDLITTSPTVPITESVTDTLTLTEQAVEVTRDILVLTEDIQVFTPTPASDDLTLTEDLVAVVTYSESVSDTVTLTEEGDSIQDLVCQTLGSALFTLTDGGSNTYVFSRRPNLSNRTRIKQKRIQRVTMNNSLDVFADPTWPKREALSYSFSVLTDTEAEGFLTFMKATLGAVLTLTDHENNQWTGVITNHRDPKVHDRAKSYTVSFEFEGTAI